MKKIPEKYLFLNRKFRNIRLIQKKITNSVIIRIFLTRKLENPLEIWINTM